MFKKTDTIEIKVINNIKLNKKEKYNIQGNTECIIEYYKKIFNQQDNIENL